MINVDDSRRPGHDANLHTVRVVQGKIFILNPEVRVLLHTEDVDRDDTHGEGGAAIEGVEEHDEDEKDVEDGPEAGTKKDVDDKGAIDDEAERTEDDEDRDVVDGFQ